MANLNDNVNLGAPPDKHDVTQDQKDRPESEQQLTHYYKIIFTLKSGVQIEICSRKPYNEDEMVDTEGGVAYYKIKGFIKTPLLVEKSIEISCPEVAATEVIKDPCIAQVIPWPKDKEFNHFGIDGQPINLSPSLRCKDGFGPLVLAEIDGAGQDKSQCGCDDCNMPSLSEIDGAGQDKTKGIRIGHPQVGPIEN